MRLRRFRHAREISSPDIHGHDLLHGRECHLLKGLHQAPILMMNQPERISGSDYGIRADVWSMGLSVLELTQNAFPYPRDLAPFELMLHISQSTPPTLQDDPTLSTPWSPAMKEFISLS